MNKLKNLRVKAFTLVEMLVVLLIISVLMLLFVPNLTKQKEAVSDTGNAAVVKVVESQAELYELKNTGDQATLSKLVAAGNISQKQADSYKAYYGRQLPIKAFTVLESLLVLMISSFILLALSSSVQATFEQIQAKIFFLEFEHFYQESQKLSVSSQRKLVLEISNQEISNGYARLPIPKGIQAPESTQIYFDKAGGNSSLSKVQFQTKEGLVTYQLYIGNGKFKKTTN